MRIKALPILLVVLFTAAALLQLTGCDKDTKAKAKKKQAKTVRVMKLSRTDIAEILSYVADLKPYTEVKIYSPVPDRIIHFPWQDGDIIRSGQVVALIRKEGLDKGLEQIMAQAEALDVQITNLKKELGRSEKLLKAGVITRQVFDQVQTSYLSTQAQRKALEASRGQLAVTANNAIVRAPISGVLANKMLERGDMAVPQIPLCRIFTIDKLKAELKLIETDVPKVKQGQEVELRMDAYPGRVFTGTLTRILPYLNADTRTNTVEVTIDNPRHPDSKQYLLKPGMFGRAEIVVEMHKNVLAAPEPALLLDNQVLSQQKEGEVLRKAFVVEGQSLAVQRLVRLGARKGSQYEVLDGLKEGEQIIIRGQHGLKDKQEVEIVAAQR